MRILIFLFLLLLPALGCYVGWHLWQMVPFGTAGKWLTVAAYVLLFALFIVSFTPVQDKLPLPVARFVYTWGCAWLVLLLYASLAFLLLDMGRLVHLVPAAFLKSNASATLLVGGLLLAIFVGGGLHYHHKYRVAQEVPSAKVSAPVRVVLASDLHIGYGNVRKELARWIDMINAENPDLVLFGGDIIDHSIRPLLEEDCAAEFRRLQVPVYACLGNHEFISGQAGAEAFYQDAGIGLLRDSVAVFGDICIIGRDDRTNQHRQSLSSLMEGVDAGKFTLLLDHQPYLLEEAEKAGIDYQFSGHTHYGQLWPASLLTRTMYEDAFGPHQRGATRYYVSSGLGIWGPRIRVGTRSEYLVLDIVP